MFLIRLCNHSNLNLLVDRARHRLISRQEDCNQPVDLQKIGHQLSIAILYYKHEQIYQT